MRYLLDRQDGVLSVAQLYGCGHTRDSVRRAVGSGRWQRILPGVVLLHDQSPSRRQLVNAAALWAGPEAHIDGESACLWHQIPVAHLDPATVHIVAPYETGARSRDFVVVRRSDIIVTGGRGAVAPYVDAATAAVVAARRAADDRAAVALLSRPLQTGTVTFDDLAIAHMHAPPRGCRQVDRAIDQLAVGVRSPGEAIAHRLFAASKVLPQIRWNCWLRLPDGGPLVCVDGLIADAGLVLEINGRAYHAWALAFEDTESRQLRLVAADLIVAPVTPRRLLVEGQAVLREVERAYVANAGRGLPAGGEVVAEPVSRLAA